MGSCQSGSLMLSSSTGCKEEEGMGKQEKEKGSVGCLTPALHSFFPKLIGPFLPEQLDRHPLSHPKTAPQTVGESTSLDPSIMRCKIFLKAQDYCV